MGQSAAVVQVMLKKTGYELLRKHEEQTFTEPLHILQGVWQYVQIELTKK
jgi:hypothetical protein